MISISSRLLTLLILLHSCHSICIHDKLSKQTQIHYFNDMQTGSRILQESVRGKMRIFMDYTNLDSITQVAKLESIKRMSNISATYFYHVIDVQRLTVLKYPAEKSRFCGLLPVPNQYVTEGAIGDLGVIVGAQTSAVSYVAQSTTCVSLKSNERPIWGMMIWNDAYAPKQQLAFQQTLYVGIHELTHILGFSVELFSKFPAGNPLHKTSDGYFFKSPQIQRQIKDYFGCLNSSGLPLEDQDSDLVSSHWEKKVIGNQYMIAENKKGAFVSRFTLALLESTGWYSINYTYAEKSVWGEGKGCQFLNIDNCASKQFCNNNKLSCDWDRTAYGHCTIDKYSGACKQVNYYINTICIDPSYINQTNNQKQWNKNANSITYDTTFEQSGHNSRCFESTFINSSVTTAPKFNFRCYRQLCSYSGQYLFIIIKIQNAEINSFIIIVCRSSGEVKSAPQYMSGTLTCPTDFKTECKKSGTCPYHCNKNGMCIDGQCLCIGSSALSYTCLDQYTVSIGKSGGYTTSKRNNDKIFIPTQSRANSHSLGSSHISNADKTNLLFAQKLSVNTPCISGSFLDPVFGMCIDCLQQFGCSYCNERGCIVCDDGKPSYKGSCLYK